MKTVYEGGFCDMKTAAEKINPEDYILSVLSPEDRLEASFKIAKEAFKKTKLTMKDIENSVKSIRRKINSLLLSAPIMVFKNFFL
jgi:hypothetical protein